MLTRFKTKLFAASEGSGVGEEKEKGEEMKEDITGDTEERNW